MAVALHRRTISSNSGKHDVELRLDRHRPERRVGAVRADEVLHQQAVDEHRLRIGHPLSGLRNDQPRHREAEGQGRQVRGQDAPGPPRGEPGDRVQPPAVASRRKGEREARQHDEDDDGESPVDEPAGPERRVVGRVARERAQEDVIDDYVQRGEAANAVQPGQPLCARIGSRQNDPVVRLGP